MAISREDLYERLAAEVVSAEDRGDKVSAEFWMGTLESAIAADDRREYGPLNIPTYYSEALGCYVTIPED